MRASLVHAAALMGAIALGPASAFAQADPTAVAVALFQQGRDLVKQGRYAEACPKLAESQRLEPKLGTLLNLAVCNEKLGKTATAWAEYGSAEAMARREGPREQEREGFAREQAANLEKKLARVTFQASAPEPGLRLTLDDQLLAEAVLGTPLPVDPGKHRISAVATGKKPWSREIDVPAEKADLSIPIPALEAAPAAPAPAPTPPAPIAVPPPAVAPPPPVVPPPPPASGPSTSTLLMGVGFGVAAAGVLVGAVTGGVALADGTSLHDTCTNNKCGSNQTGAISSAYALANTSNVSFGVAAAGLVVGLVGVFTRSTPAVPAAKAGVRITPFVGPGTAGLRGSF
jgi:hypothetical protein